jgi:ribosomal protein S18 acetylase RimI-like enzyme
MDEMQIREATAGDFDGIWPIFRDVAAAGETYAYPRDVTREQAYDYWVTMPRTTCVCVEEGAVLGTYYLRTNQPGPGSHVANCGYMVAPGARGRGVASALCDHSQALAAQLGYKAIQFNFVVSTNSVAVALWQRHGFAIVGRLPRAYAHARLGYVDVYVMYKWLAA